MHLNAARWLIFEVLLRFAYCTRSKLCFNCYDRRMAFSIQQPYYPTALHPTILPVISVECCVCRCSHHEFRQISSSRLAVGDKKLKPLAPFEAPWSFLPSPFQQPYQPHHQRDRMGNSTPHYTGKPTFVLAFSSNLHHRDKGAELWPTDFPHRCVLRFRCKPANGRPDPNATAPLLFAGLCCCIFLPPRAPSCVYRCAL